MGKLKTNKLPCAELTVLPDSGKVKEGVNMTFKFCFHSKSIFTEEEMERFDLIITPDTLGEKPIREEPVWTEDEVEDGYKWKCTLSYHLNTSGSVHGPYTVNAIERTENGNIIRDSVNCFIDQPSITFNPDIKVGLRQTPTSFTNDVLLWLTILKSTESLKFENYNSFVDLVLCGEPMVDPGKSKEVISLGTKRFLPFTDTDAYRYLKIASEAFVMTNCGVALNEQRFSGDDLDYLNSKLSLSGGPQSENELEVLWQKYLVKLNGSDLVTIPYLSIIRAKLSGQSIKNRQLGEIIEELSKLERWKETKEYLSQSSQGSAIITDIDGTSTSQNGGLTGERCVGIIGEKLSKPCLIELIWSYWMEEAMLVQTLSAISRRFQNIRSKNNDPLANMEIAPLRMLNNLLWGYIQDEQHRLSVKRRAYEYDHHYGFSLQGKAIPAIQTVDSRTKFLEAFHNLLHLTTSFYKQADDTTVIADAFPLLNALREVHLILAEGAHNQYGDLPATSRIEMLMQQWLLARPEFREFLPTRTMVAYPEPWMDRVAAMNQLQGWTDTNMINFLNLAVFGEQLLLSIRFGAWAKINDRKQAENWANFWREQIQGYIHAYRAVTGVDLTAMPVSGKIDSRPPSYHLMERLKGQLNGKAKHITTGKVGIRKKTKV